MSRTGSLYIDRNTIFHNLDGSVKLFMWICWTIFIFMFMDIRVFAIMTVLGFVLLKLAKVPFKSIKPLLIFIIVFTLFNSVLLILVTPDYGSQITGKYTVILKVFKSTLTAETVFYALTLSLKYISLLPITLLFLFTTHPSEFASSLNRLGVPYKVAYSINIALRYIPDVRDEMINIINAQEARGVAFKKGDANVFKLLKNYLTILFPLLISSLQRIEIVSNAMELRGFGKYKTRTWYHRKPLQLKDYLFVAISIIILLLGIFLKNKYLKGFYCPF